MLLLHELNNFLLNFGRVFLSSKHWWVHANPPTWHWYIIHYPTQWTFFQEQFVLLQIYQMGFFSYKEFKRFSLLISFKKFTHIVAPAYPWGLWFDQTWMCTTFGWFNTSLTLSDQMLFNRFLRTFLYLFLCKNWALIVGLA